MFVEMTCNCTSSFQVDAEDNDTLMMVWAQSFVNAHQACGFMTRPKVEDAEEKMRRYDVFYKEEREKEL